MKNNRRLLVVVMCYMFIFTLLTPTSMEATQENTKIKMNHISKTITKGKTYTLKVNGTTKPIIWSSSNQKIATVSSKGVVRGIKAGNCIIKAKVNGKIYKCKVTVKDVTVVPSYFNSMLESKERIIRDRQRAIGRNSDSFIWITDYHYNDNAHNSPSIIKHIKKNTGINKIFFGGDILTEESSKDNAYKKYLEFMEKFNGIDMIKIIGNHEFNNPDALSDGEHMEKQLTDDEIYSIMVRETYENTDIVLSNNNQCYYFDNTRTKTRYICAGANFHGGIADASVTFVKNALTTTPNGYDVLVLSHSGLNINSDNGMTSSMSSIADTIISLPSGINPIAVISGDVHKDLSITLSNGTPIISTTCDSYKQETGGLERTLGTDTEQAFDVVQIDKNNRKIYMTRIGAGSDREFTY